MISGWFHKRMMKPNRSNPAAKSLPPSRYFVKPMDSPKLNGQLCSNCADSAASDCSGYFARRPTIL
ncbi:hypothetical protein VFPPC_16196 [Pochonia chlamydosporia 170]|uniref:Uncharacterized protein n=1 Tax=Pochonia chlamydosporia 170 TaxID=1380566 RepID=A0A179FH04_METCM|nr:hypothetical protein VFPPC_16196 [Pochonia chlamydosporia 170]OAQ64283.2 hypothetical protein VFPPC_16196 [Pochonia chlamydosporia 170]